MERHQAMFYNNYMDGCLPCQIGTARNLWTHWRRTGTSTPPSELAAPPPGMPPPPETPAVPPRDSCGIEINEIGGMTSRCVYIGSLLPNTQFLNHNAYAKDSKRKKDYIPD